jgi:hypothetical protein
MAEGSQASGTSRKTELKLTNVARASLEELKLDYEDYLRQKGLTLWAEDEPLRKALVQSRCSTAEDVAVWVKEVHDGFGKKLVQGGLNGPNGLNGHGGLSGLSGNADQSIKSMSSISSIETSRSYTTYPPTYSELAANAALVLIAVATTLLDRQLKA